MALRAKDGCIIEAKICGQFSCAELVSNSIVSVSCDEEIALCTDCGIYVVGITPFRNTFQFRQYLVNLDDSDSFSSNAEAINLNDSQSPMLFFRGSISQTNACRIANWSPCGTWLAVIRGDRRMMIFAKKFVDSDLIYLSQSSSCDQATFERIFQLPNLDAVDVRWHRSCNEQRISVALSNSDVLTFRISQPEKGETQTIDASDASRSYLVELESVKRLLKSADGDNDTNLSKVGAVALAIDTDYDDFQQDSVRFSAAFADGRICIGILGSETKEEFILPADDMIASHLTFAKRGRHALVAAKLHEVHIWWLRDAASSNPSESLQIETYSRLHVSANSPIISFCLLPAVNFAAEDNDFGSLVFAMTNLRHEVRVVRVKQAQGEPEEHQVAFEAAADADADADACANHLHAVASTRGGSHLILVSSRRNLSGKRMLKRQASIVRVISLTSGLETRQFVNLLRKRIAQVPVPDWYSVTELNVRSSAGSVDQIDQMLSCDGSLEEDFCGVRLAYLFSNTQLKALPVAFGVYPTSPLLARAPDPSIFLRQAEAERSSKVDRYRVALIRHHLHDVLRNIGVLQVQEPLSGHANSLMAFCSEFCGKAAGLLGNEGIDSSLRRDLETAVGKLGGLGFGLSDESQSRMQWRRAYELCPICMNSDASPSPTCNWFTSTCSLSHTLPICGRTFLPLVRPSADVCGLVDAINPVACRSCSVRFVSITFAARFENESLQKLSASFISKHCLLCGSRLLIT